MRRLARTAAGAAVLLAAVAGAFHLPSAPLRLRPPPPTRVQAWRQQPTLESLTVERDRVAASLADIDRRMVEMQGPVVLPTDDVPASMDLEREQDYTYGYLSRSAGVYIDRDGSESGPPTGLIDIAQRNFLREVGELFRELKQSLLPRQVVRPGRVSSTESQLEYDVTAGPTAAVADNATVASDVRRAQLDSLVLSNEAVWTREEDRTQVAAPWTLKVPYYALCWVIDVAFDGRPLARFWFLETVARMPYLSYVSMLHLYETLGWWRRSAETKRVHFAEEW